MINDKPIKIIYSNSYCDKCRLGVTYEKSKEIKDNKCPICNGKLIKK